MGGSAIGRGGGWEEGVWGGKERGRGLKEIEEVESELWSERGNMWWWFSL